MVTGFLSRRLMGYLLTNALGVGDTNGTHLIKLIVQVGLAAIGVSIYAGRRTTTA